MKFLFRVPLFDFDIESMSAVQNNWKSILTAIENASPHLFAEIKDHTYQDLPSSLKNKVYKYLVRGRYRSTPFGFFSGVGIGEVNAIQKSRLDLSFRRILRHQKVKILPESESVGWKIALGGKEKIGRLYFLSYLIQEERWAMVSIPKNRIFTILIHYCSSKGEITFSKFQSWFKETNIEEIKDLWQQLIELGILSREVKWLQNHLPARKYVDIILKDKLSLSPGIEQDLNSFISTAGKLISMVRNPYLEKLSRWFQEKFDDRFVPLPLLFEYSDFLNSNFISSGDEVETKQKSLSLPNDFWSTQEIDLKGKIEESPVNDQLFDIGFVFKKLKSGGILLDNLLCNRPFSYFGRFNRDPKILEFEKEVKSKIYRSEEIIYAELKVFESQTIQSICDTKQLFEFFISPFSEKNPNSIKLDDLELGVRNGKFLLFHRKLGRRVIPVVTHPLNGKEISHPLIRLLWEIDHQQAFRLFTYQFAFNSESSFVPEIRWGRIILQAKKWNVFRGFFDTKASLKSWMAENRLPKIILLGIYDRELVLDWKRETDMEILWHEVRKHPRITLSEPVWFNNSEFESKSKQTIYPQFVVQISRERKDQIWDGFINSIEYEDKDSLYLLVRVGADECLDFLDYFFSRALTSLLVKKGIVWYYLVYPHEDIIQVRIRFLRLTSEEKKLLTSSVLEILNQASTDFEIRPYYPEIKKYGREGYKISEELFHLESEIMVGYSFGLRGLSIPFEELAEAVAELWFEVLKRSGTFSLSFSYLKERVKQISFQEKRSLNRKRDEKSEKTVQYWMPKSWKTQYIDLIFEQLKSNQTDDRKWWVFQNHIHMQVNRMFPLERKKTEDWLYIELYRRVGAAIFSRAKKIKVF